MANEINDSQFSLWRSMVALVMADGHKHSEEVAFFHDKFEKLAFSAEQKDILLGDLNSPKPVSDFFSGITEPRDRSQFIFFARQLFWCDGDFDEQEKEILERLTEKVMDKSDLEKAMHQVDELSAEFAAREAGRGLRARLADSVEWAWDKIPS